MGFTTNQWLMDVDLVANPDLAAQPEYAFQSAVLFWKIEDKGTQ